MVKTFKKYKLELFNATTKETLKKIETNNKPNVTREIRKLTLELENYVPIDFKISQSEKKYEMTDETFIKYAEEVKEDSKELNNKNKKSNKLEEEK